MKVYYTHTVYLLHVSATHVAIFSDACECGNEPSGSMKCGEFLD